MRISDKKKIIRLMATQDLSGILAKLADYTPKALVNPLFSGICHADSTTHWHAVIAMGTTVVRLADQDMEAARVVMRRFMWSLNDESGGIGWGAPEAMAECITCHPKLAEEYCHILVTYMREDGFYLEYPPLQRGLMWGICRAATKRKELLRTHHAATYLPPYLASQDPTVRGLACRAIGSLGNAEVHLTLAPLRADHEPVAWYSPEEDRVITSTVSEQAREALSTLAG